MLLLYEETIQRMILYSELCNNASEKTKYCGFLLLPLIENSTAVTICSDKQMRNDRYFEETGGCDATACQENDMLQMMQRKGEQYVEF